MLVLYDIGANINVANRTFIKAVSFKVENIRRIEVITYLGEKIYMDGIIRNTIVGVSSILLDDDFDGRIRVLSIVYMVEIVNPRFNLILG